MICERCGTVFCWDEADMTLLTGDHRRFCSGNCQRADRRWRAEQARHLTAASSRPPARQGKSAVPEYWQRALIRRVQYSSSLRNRACQPRLKLTEPVVGVRAGASDRTSSGTRQRRICRVTIRFWLRGTMTNLLNPEIGGASGSRRSPPAPADAFIGLPIRVRPAERESIRISENWHRIPFIS